MSIVAYADDIAFIVVAKTIDDVQYLAIEVVGDWLRDHEFSLASSTVNNEKIRTRNTMKYLGVTIDARMLFKDHLTIAGLKASQVARSLAGIMPNIGGPKQP